MIVLEVESAVVEVKGVVSVCVGHGSGESCRVFVSNLPFETDWRNLKDYMRKAGDVLRADVFTNERGKSRGIG